MIKRKEQLVDISELSKKTGIAASKIRYYEDLGLIKSVGRIGLKRTFSEGIIQQLSFITLAQTSGFSLNEILSMLCVNNKFKLDRKLIHEKIEEIEVSMKKLKKMKSSLVHLSKCPEEDHFQCSNFLNILKSVKLSSK